MERIAGRVLVGVRRAGSRGLAASLVLAGSLLLVGSLRAQIAEVSSMSVPHAVVDMDRVGPAGPTTRVAVNAAGTAPGGADLVRILPSANPNSIAGIYDSSTSFGRALAFDAAAGGLALVAPGGAFDAFDLRLDLAGPSREIGLAVGDWEGPMVATFFSVDRVVATFTTTPFDQTHGARKFLRATGLTFDRVDLRASTAAGNWVLAELHVESDTGYAMFGAGCPGSAGAPVLDAAAGDTPVRGRMFTIEVRNLPPGGGAFAIVYGFSRTAYPGLGALPFDLGVIGAPGCMLRCDNVASASVSHRNGVGRFGLVNPDLAALQGAVFFNQALVLDPGVNALGVTATNGGRARIR